MQLWWVSAEYLHLTRDVIESLLTNDSWLTRKLLDKLLTSYLTAYSPIMSRTRIVDNVPVKALFSKGSSLFLLPPEIHDRNKDP